MVLHRTTGGKCWGSAGGSSLMSWSYYLSVYILIIWVSIYLWLSLTSLSYCLSVYVSHLFFSLVRKSLKWPWDVKGEGERRVRVRIVWEACLQVLSIRCNENTVVHFKWNNITEVLVHGKLTLCWVWLRMRAGSLQGGISSRWTCPSIVIFSDW